MDAEHIARTRSVQAVVDGDVVLASVCHHNGVNISRAGRMIALRQLNALDTVAGWAGQLATDVGVHIGALLSIPDPPGTVLRLRRLAAVLLCGRGALCGRLLVSLGVCLRVLGGLPRVLGGRFSGLRLVTGVHSSRFSGFGVCLRCSGGIFRCFCSILTVRRRISCSFRSSTSLFRCVAVSSSLCAQCLSL